MNRVTLVLAAAALPLVVGACSSSTEVRWVKEGATQNQLRSDLYWCTRVQREAFRRQNDPTPGSPRHTFRYVDAECMRERGWRQEEVQN